MVAGDPAPRVDRWLDCRRGGRRVPGAAARRPAARRWPTPPGRHHRRSCWSVRTRRPGPAPVVPVAGEREGPASAQVRRSSPSARAPADDGRRRRRGTPAPSGAGPPAAWRGWPTRRPVWARWVARTAVAYEAVEWARVRTVPSSAGEARWPSAGAAGWPSAAGQPSAAAGAEPSAGAGRCAAESRARPAAASRRCLVPRDRPPSRWCWASAPALGRRDRRRRVALRRAPLRRAPRPGPPRARPRRAPPRRAPPRRAPPAAGSASGVSRGCPRRSRPARLDTPVPLSEQSLVDPWRPTHARVVAPSGLRLHLPPADRRRSGCPARPVSDNKARVRPVRRVRDARPAGPIPYRH